MKECLQCTEPFEPKRSDAVFCSAKCRVAANRGGAVTDKDVTDEPGETVTVKKEPKQPKASVIDPTDTPERLALIEAIRSGAAKGSLEEHPKWGTVIVRTAAEAREYDQQLENERYRVAQASKKHDFKRQLYSNLKA